MSIISGKPYKIVNREAKLALDLAKNHKSILGERIESLRSQTWIPEFLLGGSGALIKSAEEENLYIGFEGNPEEGKELIAVHIDHAKVWEIERDHAPVYLFRLKDTRFLMEFPKNNLKPGTHARLGVQFLEADNQVWIVTLVK